MYINLNNQKIEIKVAQNLKGKIIGLSFQKNINYGLLIPNCNHIHTFFMKENIDVLFLDKRNCVKYKYQSMPPYRTFGIHESLDKINVLELPQNTSQKVRIGDVLIFKSEHII